MSSTLSSSSIPYPKPAPPPSLSITSSIHPSAIFDLIACIVFEVIALSFFALRIVARCKQSGRVYTNDWAILWAIFWGTFLAINSIVAVCYGGVGHHMQEIMTLAPERVQSMLKTFLIGQFAWALANAGVKISLLDLYVKIFGSVHRRFRLMSFILMSLTVLYCLMVILVAFFSCTPFESNWNPSVKGHCADQKSAYLAEGIINLVLDVGVIALPIPSLWTLQMPVHKKIGLMVMFSGGIVICGVTIWRIELLNAMDAKDPFYAVGYLSATTNIEPLLGIALACLPITHSLLISIIRAISKGPRRIHSQRFANTDRLPQSSGDGTHQSSSYFSTNKSASERKNFTRLYDHLYPLTDMGTVVVEADRPVLQEEEDNHAILVKQTWEVAHDMEGQSHVQGPNEA